MIERTVEDLIRPALDPEQMLADLAETVRLALRAAPKLLDHRARFSGGDCEAPEYALLGLEAHDLVTVRALYAWLATFPGPTAATFSDLEVMIRTEIDARNLDDGGPF